MQKKSPKVITCIIVIRGRLENVLDATQNRFERT